MSYLDRDEAIARIRTALRRRSGVAWSVKGGRGTAWGWLRISAPPSRLGCGRFHSYVYGGDDCRDCDAQRFELYGGATECSAHACSDSCYRAYLTPEDRATLAHLLGGERVHAQGVVVSPDSREYYVRCAEGR